MKALKYFKARLNERSTYMFFLAGVGAVAAIPMPFNYIGGAFLAIASLIPDNANSPKTPILPEEGE